MLPHLTTRALRARALPSLPRLTRSYPSTTPSSPTASTPSTASSHPAPNAEGESAGTKAAEEAIREHSERVGEALFRHGGREVTTAEVVSGAPPELQYRSVRIFQPASSTMQSAGPGPRSQNWRIDWDTLPSGGRWENRLMGWASSADYMQGTRLSFKTKEDAIHFAEKQGWDYFVQQEPVKRIPPKSYAENFVHIPGKLRILRTK